MRVGWSLWRRGAKASVPSSRRDFRRGFGNECSWIVRSLGDLCSAPSTVFVIRSKDTTSAPSSRRRAPKLASVTPVIWNVPANVIAISTVGDREGLVEGLALGLVDGLALGDRDGEALGDADGLVLGEMLGLALGLIDGLADGDLEGDTDGLAVGAADGIDGLVEGLELGDADGLTECGASMKTLCATAATPAREACLA